MYLAGVNSNTRAIVGGGKKDPANTSDIIEYVTISTVGNATDFGNLSVARRFLGGFESSTRGVFAGGGTPTVSNVIDYITIATTGNATDFGDLTEARETNGASNSVRGISAGGRNPSVVNTIDYVTIASTGNATDYGDLVSAKRSGATECNGHGGLVGG